MNFKPISVDERQKLLSALRGNKDGLALLMNRKDTTFSGTSENISDEEVITTIRAVPCHY
jgi:hypothetical protein